MSDDKFPKYSNIRIDYKIWMSSCDGLEIMDDAKWNLLIAIQEYGSLMAAANKCEISYRKAWGDLKKAEAFLGFQIIEKHRGGKDGGTTALTPDGELLILSYKQFRKDFQESVHQCIIHFKKSLKTNSPTR
ncbi:MAG: LysR family transcriptional regulator [Bacteroidota bacterium]